MWTAHKYSKIGKRIVQAFTFEEERSNSWNFSDRRGINTVGFCDFASKTVSKAKGGNHTLFFTFAEDGFWSGTINASMSASA